MQHYRSLLTFLLLFFCVGLCAQTFRRVLSEEDLEVGALYLMGGRSATDADSVFVITTQMNTGAGVKKRGAKKIHLDQQGRIQVTDADIAFFELGKDGTAYTFKDVELNAYLAYSVANVTNGKSALYTMTEAELKAQPTSGPKKFSRAFVYKAIGTTKFKSPFLTKEKINNSTGAVQFSLALDKSNLDFRLFEKKDYTDSLFLFKQVMTPTIEGQATGDWVFKGDWTAEELYSIDFSTAQSVDFTHILLPPYDESKEYDGVIPNHFVWTYVRKGVANHLPKEWENVIEISNKQAKIQGTAVTDIQGSDLTVSVPKYSFSVPQDRTIVWYRDVDGDGGFYTIGLPYEVKKVTWDEPNGEDCNVRRMKYKEVSDDGVVLMELNDAEGWEADVAYVWRPVEQRGGTLCFSASGVDVFSPISKDIASAEGFYVNYGKTSIQADTDIYLLNMNGDTFVHAAEGSTVAPCRGYLVLPHAILVNLHVRMLEHQTSIREAGGTHGKITYYTYSGVPLGTFEIGAPLPSHWPKRVISVYTTP